MCDGHSRIECMVANGEVVWCQGTNLYVLPTDVAGGRHQFVAYCKLDPSKGVSRQALGTFKPSQGGREKQRLMYLDIDEVNAPPPHDSAQVSA